MDILSNNFEHETLNLIWINLTSIFFYFRGMFYERTKGTTIGSCLSHVMANIFMKHFEVSEAIKWHGWALVHPIIVLTNSIIFFSLQVFLCGLFSISEIGEPLKCYSRNKWCMFNTNMKWVKVKMNKKYKTITYLFKKYIAIIFAESLTSVCSFINSALGENMQNKGWKTWSYLIGCVFL